MRPSRKINRGFTLVELIGVLIIISVLALTALPRFSSQATFDARTFYDKAQSMVRYAQKTAIAQNRNVFIRLNGTSIALCFDNACAAGNRVLAPAGTNSGIAECSADPAWYCEGVPSGVAYTAVSALPASYVGASPTFFFNALGKPFNTADAPPATSFNLRLVITVSGDGANRLFYVEPETGYVYR